MAHHSQPSSVGKANSGMPDSDIPANRDIVPDSGHGGDTPHAPQRHGSDTAVPSPAEAESIEAASTAHDQVDTKQNSPGSNWRDEVQVIPKQRSFKLVYMALLLSVFLGALDQTIVSTALPTIVRELQGGAEYAWVGSSYLLMAACVAPLYGKLSDVLGRKPMLLTALAIFIFGSAMCGAAQSMIWLVVCRGLQGIGGGGLIQMVQISISDITSLADRGKYVGGVGAVWGIASVLGPLIGGAIVDNTTWRWTFWINLPTGGVVAAIFIFFMTIPKRSQKTLKQHIREFDIVGLVLIMGGVASLLVGLNNGEASWTSVSAYVPIAIGGVCLISGCINEVFTKQSPIVPPRLFHTRTTAAVLGISFFHAIGFFAVAYYLVLYYQILGYSALMAGVRALTFSLGCSVTSAVGGLMLKFYTNYKVIMCASLGVMTLGFGLMTMLDAYSSVAVQEIYTLIPALGLGFIFPLPLIALQSALPPSSIATGTATFGLIRTLGGAIGITIGGSIFGSKLKDNLAGVPEFQGTAALTGSASSALAYPITALANITPPELRMRVLQEYCLAIRTIWIAVTPVAGAAFILTFFLKVYTLKTANTRSSGKTKGGISPGDVEKATLRDHLDEPPLSAEKKGVAIAETAKDTTPR